MRIEVCYCNLVDQHSAASIHLSIRYIYVRSSPWLIRCKGFVEIYQALFAYTNDKHLPVSSLSGVADCQPLASVICSRLGNLFHYSLSPCQFLGCCLGLPTIVDDLPSIPSPPRATPCPWEHIGSNVGARRLGASGAQGQASGRPRLYARGFYGSRTSTQPKEMVTSRVHLHAQTHIYMNGNLTRHTTRPKDGSWLAFVSDYTTFSSINAGLDRFGRPPIYVKS